MAISLRFTSWCPLPGYRLSARRQSEGVFLDTGDAKPECWWASCWNPLVYRCYIHLLNNICCPVGFEGNLSLLGIVCFFIFAGVLTKWKVTSIEASSSSLSWWPRSEPWHPPQNRSDARIGGSAGLDRFPPPKKEPACLASAS